MVQIFLLFQLSFLNFKLRMNANLEIYQLIAKFIYLLQIFFMMTTQLLMITNSFLFAYPFFISFMFLWLIPALFRLLFSLFMIKVHMMPFGWIKKLNQMNITMVYFFLPSFNSLLSFFIISPFSLNIHILSCSFPIIFPFQLIFSLFLHQPFFGV